MSLRVVRGVEEWRTLSNQRTQAGLPVLPRRTAVAIGNFDGVHAGHQAILRRVIAYAREAGALAAAVTFDPHPLKILRPQPSAAVAQAILPVSAG